MMPARLAQSCFDSLWASLAMFSCCDAVEAAYADLDLGR